MTNVGRCSDWIVVGGGIVGSALGYELARVGFSVQLLEQSPAPANATRYSYGGISYWSATTAFMRQLSQEGIALYRDLSAELDSDIQFQERDLLLTIEPGCDPAAIAATYADCLQPPRLLDVSTAMDVEPLLNPDAIAAALYATHGHVEPERMTQAYQQAMTRLGGRVEYATVQDFLRTGDRIQGVVTSAGTFTAANVVVSVGGLCRSLLKKVGVTLPIYFTQAEVVDLEPSHVKVRSLLMPAVLKRFALEATAGDIKNDVQWDVPDQEIAPPILDVGIVPFQDGRIRLGQISRVCTTPRLVANATQSEQEIRYGATKLIPQLHGLPGTWGSCLVAFSGDRLPLIGTLPGLEGIHLFSGFSNPFALMPPLARRYAQHLKGSVDKEMAQFEPARFALVDAPTP